MRERGSEKRVRGNGREGKDLVDRVIERTVERVSAKGS